MFDELISIGHREQDIWNYTPRKAAAFLSVAERRRKREKAERLKHQAIAASNDTNAIKDAIGELQKE